LCKLEALTAQTQEENKKIKVWQHTQEDNQAVQ
jgi:hypothetical protein